LFPKSKLHFSCERRSVNEEFQDKLAKRPPFLASQPVVAAVVSPLIIIPAGRNS